MVFKGAVLFLRGVVTLLGRNSNLISCVYMGCYKVRPETSQHI